MLFDLIWAKLSEKLYIAYQIDQKHHYVTSTVGSFGQPIFFELGAAYNDPL